MYLAIKEMRYAKLRYGLIIAIMFLVAYVVFMLSGLAIGLANQFDQGIVDWQADHVVLAKDANKSFAASQLKRSDLDQVTTDEKAPIGLYNGAVSEKGKKLDITVFGTTEEAFLLPKLTKGKMFTKNNEIVVSENLAEEGFKIGDKVKIGKYATKLTIVGIAPKSYYAVTPVIYTDLDTWTKIKYNDTPYAENGQKPLNAIVTKGKTTIAKDADENLQKLPVADFINSLPGYSAQNLTLNAMIYFLFVIVAAIVGIFMYVITMQKTSIFGVMKAQGISNGLIANSIIAQAFLVGVFGVVLAFAAAWGTSFVLPKAMPFLVSLSQWGLYSGVLILVAVLGGLFSIRTVAKVDPITAIGG